MFTPYVLYSKSFEKIYIGHTSDMDQRLRSHNESGIGRWTTKFRPWKLFYTEQFAERSQAMKHERELKTATGRKWIWDMIKQKDSI